LKEDIRDNIMRKKDHEREHKHYQLLRKDKYSQAKENKVDKIYLIDQYVGNLSLFMLILILATRIL